MARAINIKPPKILLETLTSSTAKILFLLNVVSFLIGFLLDLSSSLSTYTNESRSLIQSDFYCHNISSSSSMSIANVNLPRGNWGCTVAESEQSVTWMGHVQDITNIVAFRLSVEQKNITSNKICANNFQSGQFSTTVETYACFKSAECSSSDWMYVLTEGPDVVSFLSELDYGTRSAQLDILPYTFQNQPSLASKGMIQSYLFFVKYSYDLPLSALFDNSNHATSYKFYYTSVPSNIGTDVTLQILLLITLFSLTYYGYELFIYRYTEQIPDPKNATAVTKSNSHNAINTPSTDVTSIISPLHIITEIPHMTSIAPTAAAVTVADESGEAVGVLTKESSSPPPAHRSSLSPSRFSRRASRSSSVFDLESSVQFVLPDMRQWASTPNELMPEQIWVFVYGIAVILLQNPVYSFICWQDVHYTSNAFAYYVIDALAQALLFTVWYLLASGARRSMRREEATLNQKELKRRQYSQTSEEVVVNGVFVDNHWTTVKFYAPKVIFGIVLFILKVVAINLQFTQVGWV